MKKIFISLFVLIILGLFSTNTIFAQANNFGSLSGGVIVATVSINNAKIVSQNDRDFVISFNISNKTGAQPKVKYSVQLTKVLSLAQTILDEKVYSDVLFLGENMSINKTIKYSIPPQIIAGNYSLFIRSENESGLPLAIAFLGNIKIVENTANIVEIVPSSCIFTTTIEKPLFSSSTQILNKILTTKCKVVSTFPSDIVLKPNFVTRNHTLFGSIIPLSVESTQNTIIKKGTNNIIIKLPQASKPQDYNLSFFLVSPDGKTISNTISYNYTVAGNSGTIKNVIFDKTYYKTGDTANLQIFSTQTSTSTLTALITNGSGLLCAATSTKEVPSISIANILIPITKDCLNPKAKVTLSANGTILDSNNFQIITSVKPTTSLTNISTPTRLILVVIIIIIILILGIIIYRKKYFGLKLLLLLFVSASLWFGIAKNVVATSSCEILHCLPPSTCDYLGTCSTSYYCAGDVRMRLTGGSCGTTYYSDPDHVTGISPDETLESTCSFGCLNGQCIGRAHIINFSYDSGSVIWGGSTNLRWTAQNTSGCYINRNDSLFAGGLGSSGSVSTGPLTEARNVYQLICNSFNNSRLGPTYSATIGVNVTNFPLAIASFTVTPNPLNYDSNSATVSWTSTGADSCEVDGFSGQSASGQIQETLSTPIIAPKTFNITCTNNSGSSVSTSTTVGVNFPIPTISPLSASQNPVKNNGLTIISANVSNSGSCIITSNNGGTIVYSNVLSPTTISAYAENLKSTTTFSASCTSIDNSTTVYATPLTVSVLNPSPFNVNIYANPNPVIKDGDSQINLTSNYPGLCSVKSNDLVYGMRDWGSSPTVGNDSFFYVGPISTTTKFTADCSDNDYLNSLYSDVPAPQTGSIISINSTPIQAGSGYQDGQIVNIPNGNNGSVQTNVTFPYGGIISLTLNGGGQGYSVGDILTIGGGDWNAEVKVLGTDGVAGAIKDYYMVYGGSGYSKGDQLTITGGNNDAVGTVNDVDENGTVTDFSLNGNDYLGSGYYTGSYSMTTGGSGSGLVIFINSIYGAITSLSDIINPGSGYNQGDQLNLFGPPTSPGDAEVVIDKVGTGQISSVSLQNGGSGYYVQPYYLDNSGFYGAEIQITNVLGEVSPISTYLGSSSVDVYIQSSTPHIHAFRAMVPEIDWSVDNADSCDLENSNGDKIFSSTSPDVVFPYSIKINDIYTLVCHNSSGDSTMTATGESTELSSTCAPSQGTSTVDMFVNKNTKWTINYNGDGISSKTVWWGDDIPTAIDTTGPSLEKIYTTVGTKTINGRTTVISNGTSFESQCSTTTTVKLDKGKNQEI